MKVATAFRYCAHVTRVLLLLAAVGCFRHSSERAILAQLVPDSGLGLTDQGIKAEYVAFEDDLTGSAWKRLGKLYRIAPKGTSLLCPSNPAAGMHGYNLSGRVQVITPAQAIGEISSTCNASGSSVTRVSSYLFARRSGQWVIEKPLSGAVFVPSGPMIENVSMPAISSTPQRILGRLGARRGRLIRISSNESGRIEGHGFHLRGDTAFVVNNEETRAIAVADIDSAWTQRGTAAGIVGLISAAPCALWGMILGNFLATDPDGNRPVPGPIGALIGGVIGGGACGLVGGALGSFIKRWRLEYTRS